MRYLKEDLEAKGSVNAGMESWDFSAAKFQCHVCNAVCVRRQLCWWQ